MITRGWLIVGTTPVPAQLFYGYIPDAAYSPPGSYIGWSPAPGAAPIYMVCVEFQT